MAACLGLLLGTVGLDGVTGHERFTFGALPLISGIPLLIVMVGRHVLAVARARARPHGRWPSAR